MSSCRICGAELYGPFCPRCGAAQNENAEPPRASVANPYEAGSAPSPPPARFRSFGPALLGRGPPGLGDEFCVVGVSSRRSRSARLLAGLWFGDERPPRRASDARPE